MKAEQVDQALHQKFVSENARLVFWHDEKGEFAEYVAGGFTGELAEVNLLDVAPLGGMAAKLRLEREDRTGKYLVYSQGQVPPAEEDWLLDIRLYSHEFHADMASLWLQELGLNRLSLRDHLKARAAFLGNQERRRKLAKSASAGDDEEALDLKMMAVLLGCQATPLSVLRALCQSHTKEGRFDLDEPPEAMATLEKMDLLARFWELMDREFAYKAESPSLARLIRGIFLSDLFHQAEGANLQSLSHYRLPAAGRRNAVVFLTQWRDSSAAASSHDAVAKAVAAEQKLDETLDALDLENLRNVYTFWEAERRVVSRLKKGLLDQTQSVELGPLAELVNERKSGHWLCGPGSNLPERRAMADAYDAILSAAELFALHSIYRKAWHFENPLEVLTGYREELYRFDQLYRSFCSRAKSALGQSWDLLKTLAEEVERVYDQGFLQPMGIEWSRLLDEGFLKSWSLPDLRSQRNFYAGIIHEHLIQNERKRAFVIISDAFRYEAAQELTAHLNGQEGIKAELSAMLGVLPSYTALGMASLLPHKKLAYNDKGDVLVDDKPVASTEARSKQLATVQGMACQARDLLVMKTDEAREFTKDKRVVYIYHNVIDSRGESAATEGETFEAVAACIKELADLVEFCVNKFNASKIWVTADHGFLFQVKAPDETDKSQLSHKPKQAVKDKKRYVIGPNLGPTPEAHHGVIGVTASEKGGMEFWVPRAANRFHFAGGARYLHGGAMPQEVLVPLITVTQIRGQQAEKTKVDKVSVQVLKTKHKITTPKHRFEFIQTEAVGERRKPITMRVAVYDPRNEAVTTIETLTFDSASDSIADRQKSVILELRSGTFDKSTPYRLVLRDIETDAEVQSIPVVIDRSFDDDF